MKFLFTYRLYAIVLFFALTVLGCKENEPEPAQAPSDLAYSPSTLTVVQGSTANSAKPSIKGTTPITYTVSSSPTQAGITINAEGIIQVANTVPVGTYSLSVTANNAGGNKTFSNIFTVTVNAPTFVASNLAYSPNTLTITEGNAGTSATPSISGTAPFTYQVSTSPNTASITINSQGVIQVANTIAQGTYNVSVSATNSAGTANFNNVYTVTVNAAPIAPANLVYSPISFTVLQGTAQTSNLPSIQGTQPISFEITSVTPANAAISINAQNGRITVANNSTAGAFKVSVKATNSVGNTTFTDVFTVNVRAPITFNADIQPLLQSRCSPCHVAGGSQPTNWTVYNTSKLSIDNIINRVQRTQGSAGFMPQGGQPLSATDINKLQQWKLDGLKEQ